MQSMKGALSKLVSVVIVLSLASGCEARLDLEGVENTLKQSVRRTDQLLSIEQLSDGSLIMFGNDGLLLTKSIGNQDWHRTQLRQDNISPNFIDSTVCNDQTIVALAYENQLWVSSDNGANWTTQVIPTQENLQAVDCTSTGDIWVVGSFSTLMKTEDRGLNWTTNSMQEDSMLTQVSFISENTGYAVGEFGLLLKTEDSGANWELLDPISDDFYPLAAYFQDDQNGWVGGLQGVIMKTIDGGRSWQRQVVNSEVPIYNFVSAGVMYATGDRGTVLKNSGNEWNPVDVPEIPTYYRTGVVLDDNSMLLAGGWGVLTTVSLNNTSVKE